jgi:hypothetical protein
MPVQPPLAALTLFRIGLQSAWDLSPLHHRGQAMSDMQKHFSQQQRKSTRLLVALATVVLPGYAAYLARDSGGSGSSVLAPELNA